MTIQPEEFNRRIDAIEALAKAGEESDHTALEELKATVKVAYQALYHEVGQLRREDDLVWVDEDTDDDLICDEDEECDGL